MVQNDSQFSRGASTTKLTARQIEKAAQEMRLIQAEMSRAFPCYLGSSLSVTDILAVLYFSVMNVRTDQPNDPKRDFLILSKGHASPALYAALHLRGYISKEALVKHSTLASPVYWNTNHKLPGVELSTGSLGHGLGFGLGVALAQKQAGYDSRVFVILGDGELDEGSNWEAILSAPAFKLGNLVAIVDRNGKQANKPTEDLVPLEDLAAKWQVFGWQTKVVDGHNVVELQRVLGRPNKTVDKPLVVIAHTVRGKGISFLEDRQDAWLWQLSEDEFKKACKEIQGSTQAEQASTIMRHGKDAE